MADIKIAVSSQSLCWVPEGEAFVPVLSGAALLDGPVPEGWNADVTPDDDCPSSRAYAYGELTALWWAWHALEADYVGLAPDGRFLASSYSFDRKRRVADAAYLSHRLATRPVVLPNEGNWVLESAKAHYARTHRSLGVDVLREVVGEDAPWLQPALESRLRLPHGHASNVMLMRRDLLDDYCSMLFEVMADVEASLLALGSDSIEEGELAALATLLVDPWLEARGITPVEVASVNVNGRAGVPSNAEYLERQYRAKYGAPAKVAPAKDAPADKNQGE